MVMGNNLPIKPWDPHTSNEEIIAAIRYEASSEYQRRIPDEIKANVQATLKELLNYQPAMNEFIGAIVNKIGLTIARNNSWSNPLARYKKGLFESGDTVEEIQTGIVKGYVFDPRREYGEKALFGKHIPEVQTSYHRINSERIYPLTVQRSTLQRAFLKPDGLAQFITQLMDSLSTADNYDEFLLMCSLFTEYEANDGFFKVHVEDIANPNLSKEGAQRGLRTLREYAETMPFLSSHYNAAKMPVHSNPEDMILLMTPQFKSGVDVMALADLFNVSYAEAPYRTHVIPRENMGIQGVDAILTTKDFFQIYDTYFSTESQPNPAGRYENFFLHHDQIISASRFVPAIAFTTGEGDVIEIVDTPVTGVEDITITDSTGQAVTDVKRGESYIVRSSAITEGDNTAVVLRMTEDISPRTYLAQTGTFHISEDEKSDELVLTATATDDNAQTKTRTVKVVGTRVDYWPNPGVVEDEDNDGVPEVTPEPLTMSTDKKVTIPAVTGVQYKKAGANVNNGTVHEITEETVFTAEARPNYELKPGAVTSWTFQP